MGPREVGSSVLAPECGEGWFSKLASTLASAFARRVGAIEKNGIREVFEKTKKNGGSGLEKKGGMVRRLVWRSDSVILGRPVCPRNSCLVGPKIVRPKWEIEYLRKKWLVQECRIRTSHFAFKTAVLQFRFGFRLSGFLQHYARFWAIIHFGCEESAVFARKWLVRGFSD